MAGRGQPKTGGRKAGTPNGLGRSVREAIVAALDRAGGADYLARVAQDDTRTFCALPGRLLPSEVWLDEPPPEPALELSKLSEEELMTKLALTEKAQS